MSLSSFIVCRVIEFREAVVCRKWCWWPVKEDIPSAWFAVRAELAWSITTSQLQGTTYSSPHEWGEMLAKTNSLRSLITGISTARRQPVVAADGSSSEWGRSWSSAGKVVNETLLQYFYLLNSCLALHFCAFVRKWWCVTLRKGYQQKTQCIIRTFLTCLTSYTAGTNRAVDAYQS